ncbi:hypothetical protein SAMN05443248_4200 [Bradyrhizobium erythrophlei]|uniref:Uncharacterized protein n=1 Tax=Bradyrhizobium erythrophlei TaxID=1437360 RepID=A0A1M5RF14_9BRAD|nr:hypothetical protein SAMN05443248_4200 [Bradyrhizobium erythrophlei]
MLFGRMYPSTAAGLGAIRVCLSEIKHAQTGDEVRQEMA